MGSYKNRHREKHISASNKSLEEHQLTLNLRKEELFDPYIVLPHPEINPKVYTAVDQFVQRYGGNSLKITIMCGLLNPSLEEVFRESYLNHYDDEYQKTQQYLNRRYIRVVILLLISIASFFAGSFLSSHLTRLEFVAGIVMEVSIFCLWEIGYTHFDRSDATIRKKMILRAKNAEIEFL